MNLPQNANKMKLTIILSISIISILLSVYISILIEQYVNPSIMKMNPIAINTFTNSDEIFTTTPMKKELFTKEEFETLTKQLIKEYIKTRYTITGSPYTMQIDLGIGDKEDISTHASKLKLPSLTGNNYNDTYKNFISGKNNDKEEITKLQNEKTTRSVRIIEEPYKYRDRWKTIVEFIYKTPTTNNLDEATRELWEINMEIDELTGFRNVERASPFLANNPSSLFGFKINWIEKIRK